MKSKKIKKTVWQSWLEWKESNAGHEAWDSARRKYPKYNYNSNHTDEATMQIWYEFEGWCIEDRGYSQKQMDSANEKIIGDITAGLT
jgi:hypothetical protein